MAEDLKIEVEGVEDIGDRLRQYAELAQVTIYESVFRFARKLAFEIYIASKEAAPNVQEIFELPARLQWRIRRHDNRKTVEQEIWARARAVGVTAVGWLSAAKQLQAEEGGNIEDDPANLASRTVVWRLGGVEIVLNGTQPYIALENFTPGAEILEAKTGLLSRALADTVADLDEYLERKLVEQAQELGFEAHAG